MGWKPAQKIVEMESPELRYVLVKDPGGVVRGFTSLMPTYEEGKPVVYCYEIHLKPELRGYVFVSNLSLFFSPSFRYSITIQSEEA